MRKIQQSFLALFLGLLLFLSVLPVAAERSWPRNISVAKTSLVINNYEFGPAVDKLVLEMNDYVTRVDTSSLQVKTMGVDRRVTKAYLSDAQGREARQNASKYLALDLAVDSFNSDDPTQTAQPFSFDLTTYRNSWVSSYPVKVDGLRLSPYYGRRLIQVNSEQETIANKIIPSAQVFSERGAYSLPYAAYQPQSAGSGEKKPLLVWLHGIGEAGEDINFPLLANEVNKLTQEEIQSHFTSTGTGAQKGAYVLIPQSPTAWGESQEAALKETIESYVAAHPDIDRSRIYLMGGSNGASMTVDMGVSYPDTFAALVPIAGLLSSRVQVTESAGDNIYSLDEKSMTALKDQPIWLITARADESVPVDSNTLPFYKGLLHGGASNKWLTYYENVQGTELAQTYNGHWSWIYLFHDQITGVQNPDNARTWPGLTGMVATDAAKGGDAQATVNGQAYNNIFDWLNAQRR
ncbi:PHB depolymerase family esterase [Streptococcus oricebi]|uniref:Glucan-binding protein n=1 Tax=Streptococcus oricebi TaxID=1547447 RepID=A0ABS5B3Q1_9STRE|nr:PHB depolymerase family esterase [Streptococcus oricebi]MBP2623457.1 glucan-binding protein [Streptococcus oricebi]